MKAVLIGLENIGKYINAKGEEKPGGYKLYFASSDAFSRSAIESNNFKGVCPLKNSYWVGKGSNLENVIKNVKTIPCDVELNFSYQGYLTDISIK